MLLAKGRCGCKPRFLSHPLHDHHHQPQLQENTTTTTSSSSSVQIHLHFQATDQTASATIDRQVKSLNRFCSCYLAAIVSSYNTHNLYKRTLPVNLTASSPSNPSPPPSSYIYQIHTSIDGTCVYFSTNSPT